MPIQGHKVKIVTSKDYVHEWHETMRQGWRDARAGRGFHEAYETADARGQQAYERGRLLGVILGGNCTNVKMAKGLHDHGDRRNNERLIP